MNIKLKKGEVMPSYSQLIQENTYLRTSLSQANQKIRTLQMNNHSLRVKLQQYQKQSLKDTIHTKINIKKEQKYITSGISQSNIKDFRLRNKLYNRESSQEQVFTNSDQQSQGQNKNKLHYSQKSIEGSKRNQDEMNFTDNEQINSNLGLSQSQHSPTRAALSFLPDVPIINSKTSSNSDFHQYTLSKSSDQTLLAFSQDNSKELHLGKVSSVQEKLSNDKNTNQNKLLNMNRSKHQNTNRSKHQKLESSRDDIRQQIHQQSPSILKLSGMNVSLYDSIMNFRASLGDSKIRSFIVDPNFKSTSRLFNKVKSSKSIYQTFFVTGYSLAQGQPQVQYFYPKHSNHFKAILNLCFNQESFQGLTKGTTVTENTHNTHSQPQLKNTSHYSASKAVQNYRIKDTFVMPIKKQGSSDESGQIEYLIATQVDDFYYDLRQNSYVCFPRLYCFISSCKFFNVFQNISCQMIELVNKNLQDKILRQKQKKSFVWLEKNHSKIIMATLEQSLKRLSSQNVQDNQYINIALNQKIKILIDVPPADESYMMLIEYKQWNILNMNVGIRKQSVVQTPRNQDQKKSLETKLAGVFIIYLLSQIKIVLYSNFRSKISQLILHSLQIIKPLEYVNPIMMAVLRQSFQQYLEAPIPIVLGFSGQNKKQKQKIEIFMHKKTNSSLSKQIQKGHLHLDDGIVFNLDTGYIYGGVVDSELNSLAVELNQILQIGKNKSSPKHLYTVFQRMMTKNSSRSKNSVYNLSSSYKMDQVTRFWMKLHEKLKHTQHYNFYLQKDNLDSSES